MLNPQVAIALISAVILLAVGIAGAVYIHSLHERLALLEGVNEKLRFTMGRFLAIFSNHVDSLERYRSSLRNVSKSMDLRDIIQALKSDEFIDAERESLYQEFDRAFLEIYPDFINQLNALLQEGKQIGLGLPEGKLSNELRVFALIRLGVSESGQIARFLKKSPSTVYNYRVKLRNASVYPNDEFETHLMQIGNA